tara:strand:+ start:623 stop:1900 length:1278 start_codon:yes stop_codon:yes gene_type:complete
MSENVIEIDDLSKQYRLGLVDVRTLSDDIKRRWALFRGKEDPLLKIGDRNTRNEVGGDYVWALKDVNLKVKKGEVLGIIGKNGAGKSTLLKLLSQITEPSTGEIRVKGRIASLLEVGTGFHPELTGRENIFLNGAILGMTKPEIRSKLDEIIEFSGVQRYIDTPVKRYSSGMKVRLGFAVAAHLEPEILVVDEVLAVGDAEFQKKSLGKMQEVSRSGRTILFVSHNLGSVAELCTRAILLEDGTITYDSTPEKTISKYLITQKNNQNPYTAERKEELLKVIKVQVSSQQGAPETQFDLQDAITLEITIDAQEDLEEVRINLMLYRELDLLFHTRVTDQIQEEIRLKAGKHTYQLVLNPMCMTAGSYSFDVVATYKGGLKGGQFREILERVNSFEIEERSINTEELGFAAKRGGAIIAPGNWTKTT